MRALIQALQCSTRATLSKGGPWGLAAPARGAAELAAAAAAAAGQPLLREFDIYRWDTDKYQSYSVDVDRYATGACYLLNRCSRQLCRRNELERAFSPPWMQLWPHAA